VNDLPVSSEPSKGIGCALALGIGLLTVVVETGTFSLATGRAVNLKDEWESFFVQVVFVAAPFGLLSLARIKDRAAWLTGLALTAAFWGYYLFDGIRYQLGGDKSGVNLGLVFLMLLSPVIISAVCLGIAKANRGRP
jgi:hypothetical protein